MHTKCARCVASGMNGIMSYGTSSYRSVRHPCIHMALPVQGDAVMFQLLVRHDALIPVKTTSDQSVVSKPSQYLVKRTPLHVLLAKPCSMPGRSSGHRCDGDGLAACQES